MLPNAQPKPKPRLLDKRQRAADVVKVDRKQRELCHVRSGGRCEVWTDRTAGTSVAPLMIWPYRCERRANENHHLIGGIGRRNKGRSILAAHRLDVCDRCHEEITGKVLVPCVPQDKAECAATVRYERVK